jgi:GTPase
VVDVTSHNAAEQCEVVDDVLNDLGLQSKPHITILNKIDLLLNPDKEWDEASAMRFLKELAGDNPDSVLVSATRRWGLKQLIATLAEMLKELPNTASPVSENDAL